MLKRVAQVACTFLLCWAGGEAAAADSNTDYLLGPQDHVKIKAYDWRPGSDDTHEWTALTGEFTVSAAGTLSLPVAGEVKVAHSTTSEVASRLARQMQKRLGLANEPFVAIEVSKFRPFYIVGAVQKPGEYAFRPGLTVLQATAIAGGPQRLDDMGLIMLEKDAIAGRGDFRNLEAERLQLLMKQARLKAQIEDRAEIAIPADIKTQKDDPAMIRLVSEETELFDSKRKSTKAQIDILEQTKVFLQKEIASLQDKQLSHSRQIDLIGKERQMVNDLLARGLTSSVRQVTVEQSLAQYESMRLDAKLAELKARQDLAQADRDILEIRNKFLSTALADANEVRARLAVIEERKKAASALVYEAEVRGPQVVDNSADDRITTAYILTREKGGVVATSPVTEADVIEPGDTVRVERRHGVSVSQKD